MAVVFKSKATVSAGLPAAVFSRELANARAFEIFEAPGLRNKLRGEKLEIERVWEAIASWLSDAPTQSPLRKSNLLVTHEKLVQGIPGSALYVSSALAFDSLRESLVFFELSPKTAKQRLNQNLPLAEGERALRLTRAFLMAQESLGDAEAAREYLKTPNFALGGQAPRDLLKTAEGEQIVINEIQTQAAGGPL